MTNHITLNFQLQCINTQGIPNHNKIKLWTKNIFSLYTQKLELTIRIVDISEMIYLNWYYSGKRYPTNVLSFPFNPPKKIKSNLLGDIVICKKIIELESKQYHVFSDAHWAHMIIHGSLHLLGYNHIIETEAQVMNKLELNMIQKLGYKTCCLI